MRLRDVYLKEDSRWKDVLSALKREMHSLEWLSLRRIGYGGPEELNGGGAEVPDEPDLDSSTDESIEQSDEEDTDVPVAGPSDSHRTNGHAHSNDHDDSEEHLSSDEDGDDDGPEAHETEFPRTILTQSMPALRPTGNGANGASHDTEIDLEDDGRLITRQKRKQWEEWVVGKKRGARVVHQ